MLIEILRSPFIDPLVNKATEVSRLEDHESLAWFSELENWDKLYYNTKSLLFKLSHILETNKGRPAEIFLELWKMSGRILWKRSFKIDKESLLTTSEFSSSQLRNFLNQNCFPLNDIILMIKSILNTVKYLQKRYDHLNEWVSSVSK